MVYEQNSMMAIEFAIIETSDDVKGRWDEICVCIMHALRESIKTTSMEDVNTRVLEKINNI